MGKDKGIHRIMIYYAKVNGDTWLSLKKPHPVHPKYPFNHGHVLVAKRPSYK